MSETDSSEESELPMNRVSDALRATVADKYCSDQMRKLIELNNLIPQIKLTDTPDDVGVMRDLKEDGTKKQTTDRCEQANEPWQKSTSQNQVEAQFDHENIGTNDKYMSGPGNLQDNKVENLLLTQSRAEVDAMAVELNKIKEENALIKVEMVEILSIKEKLAKDLDCTSGQLGELKKENVDNKKREQDLKEKLTLTETERNKIMDSALKALIDVEVERKVFKLEEEMKAIRRQSEDKNEQLMKLGRNFMEVLTLAKNENSSNNEEDTESNRQKPYVMSRNEKFANPEQNSSIFEKCELFVHGIGEHIQHHEMMAEFGKYGTVTDAYNTGKGYAFITYSSPAEAKACLGSINGRNVFGRIVQIKQAEQNSFIFEKCQLFVHGIGEHIKHHEMVTEFGKYGTVTDAYNTGKGYAFITFSSPAEAKDCLMSMNARREFGQAVQIKPAFDRGQSNIPQKCQLFLHGVDEHIKRHEMMAEFGKCGTVTDACNTGKGYAFITYSSPAEAKDCLRRMNGRSVFGRTVQIKQAFDRRQSNLPPRLGKQREVTTATARGSDKNNNFAIEEKHPGSVVMIYNLNLEFMDCDRLFNLISPYALVKSINFLQQGGFRRGCKALVELNSKEGAQRVMKFMNEETVFGETMRLVPSPKLRVTEFNLDQSPSLPNGTKAFKDFCQDNQRHCFHYFRNLSGCSFMYPPSRTVYFCKVPKMSDKDLKEIFEKRQAPVPYKIMCFQNKHGSGCLQFKTKEEALQAMCLANLALTKSGRSVHLAFTYERKDGEFYS